MSNLKLHCNRCGGSTQHELILARQVDEHVDGDSENSSYDWRNTYEVFECRGCGTVCLRDTYTDLDDREEVQFYPAPMSRRPPHWRRELPEEIRELMEELYVSIQNNAPRLALMGARSVIDMLAVREAGDVGSFTAKLAALEQKGLIGKRNSEQLAVALDAGNAAAHRGFKPDPDVLSTVVDIVENLLQTTYHLRVSAERVKREIPPRSRVH